MPISISQREVSRLNAFLPDGQRTYSKRDELQSERIRSLFHSGPAEERACGGGRGLVPLHSSPNIYKVERFVSPREIEHLDRLITSRRAAFKRSHTDDVEGNDALTAERTSLSLILPKGADATLRAIEARVRLCI